MQKKIIKTALLSSLILAIYGVMPVLIFNTAPIPQAILSIVFLYVFILACWLFNIWLHRFRLKKTVNYALSFFGVILFQSLIVFLIPLGGEVNIPNTFFIFPILSIVVVNSAILMLFNTIQNQFLKKEAERNVEQLAIANLEVEKRILQQQLHPHFLFNSLSTIKSLIRINPDSAEEYTIRLSEFLRFSLLNQTKDLSPVSKEVLFTIMYLDLQTMRFGSAIEITQNIDDSDFSREIPIFALQTLIENALKHNAFSEKKPLKISIVSNGKNLIVKNNLIPKKGVESSGTGLSNLSKRYRLIRNLDIEIIKDAEYFTVSIPLL